MTLLEKPRANYYSALSIQSCPVSPEQVVSLGESPIFIFIFILYSSQFIYSLLLGIGIMTTM
jgi:uncharacterized membrane protein